jgi:hypothetical protein
MRRIQRFTLLSPGNACGASQLVSGGTVTRVSVPGIELLDQFETAAGYLLVTDHDCPFEETFHFLLLDRDLHIRTRRSLGAGFAFVPGSQARTLEQLVWEDDLHFLAVLAGPAERWRFTIRHAGIPLIHPRLTATRV